MTSTLKPTIGLAARAARVGELLPVARLQPDVLAWAERRPRAEAWAVALSGGADSVALLLLLWAHFPDKRDRLVALHYNHRLRGRSSEADEKYCRDLCRRLGVRMRTGAWRAARAGAGEAAAREARHAFFARELKRLGTRVLWLAHQQDDVAETLLMRVARGSGTAGLAAPRPVQTVEQRFHLRPLLDLKKAELTAALRTAGVHWREDASNAGGAFFRNRLRHDVIPAWIQAAGRDALAGAGLARSRLEEDDAALETWLDAIRPLERRTLVTSKLADLPTALWRRALHRWLLAVRPDTDLSRQGFDQLLAALRRGRDTRFSLGASGFAVLRRGRLTLKNIVR